MEETYCEEEKKYIKFLRDLLYFYKTETKYMYLEVIWITYIWSASQI